jgi:Asp-tRNA(Asn)/Glu-tRNA(Gln) amidotransferase A subunit family amidase
VVGFKPTFGLVSLEGVFPLAPTFDHAGPMARTVADCVGAMEALAPGLDLSDREPRVGVAWIDQSDELVGKRVQETAERLNASPVEFPLPQQIGSAFMREVADVHRDLFAEHRDQYGDNVRTKIERCLAVSDAEYAAALKRREQYREQSEEAFTGLDLLLAPTLAFVPPPADVDDLVVRDAMIRLTYPFNALGWPALALPAGTAEDGLPASVQIVGRPGDDGLVLAAGLSLERGTA